MINGIIRFAVSQRVLVLFMVAILIGAGLTAFNIFRSTRCRT